MVDGAGKVMFNYCKQKVDIQLLGTKQKVKDTHVCFPTKNVGDMDWLLGLDFLRKLPINVSLVPMIFLMTVVPL